MKQGLCEGGEDCTGTASLRLLLQPHCRASVRADPRHKAEEITLSTDRRSAVHWRVFP